MGKILLLRIRRLHNDTASPYLSRSPPCHAQKEATFLPAFRRVGNDSGQSTLQPCNLPLQLPVRPLQPAEIVCRPLEHDALRRSSSVLAFPSPSSPFRLAVGSLAGASLVIIFVRFCCCACCCCERYPAARFSSKQEVDESLVVLLDGHPTPLLRGDVVGPLRTDAILVTSESIDDDRRGICTCDILGGGIVV